jgi:hypothetical protein
MKKLFLFFIDGIGLGDAVSSIANLFTNITGKALIARDEPLFVNSGVICSVDATLDTSGVPQSATGQATIFTGINASKYLGYHLTALPNQKLVELIEEQSLMKSLAEHGINVTSANMYSDEFFHKRAARRRNAFPVSTLTIKASGIPFRYFSDYEKGCAVFADITNKLIRERGYDIAEISPETAAGNLLNILENNQFIFFEYFMTDLYGHKRDKTAITECVDILNRFTETIWSGINNNETSILIISDHGNAEDLSTGDHTFNDVPAILLTKNKEEAKHFADSIHSLVDIYPWVLEYFSASAAKSD